ncbi:MAG: DUF2842 domain-containing protein [Planctomycetota bacterium]
MALSYKARKRWSLVILLLGLPIYIVVVETLRAQFDRPPIAVEFLIYAVVGILWALPFRFIFRGVGQADPDAPADETRDG